MVFRQRCWCWSTTWGSIYKIKRVQKVNYFFIGTPCGLKLLHNWIRKYWFIKVGERSEPRKFWKIVFLTTKYEQIVTLEHLLCPKVGGGAQTHLCPPTFESGGGGGTCPPAPFSYALELCFVKLPQCLVDIMIDKGLCKNHAILQPPPLLNESGKSLAHRAKCSYLIN